MSPDIARDLWAQLLESVSDELPHSPILHHVLESVLVDIVDNRVRSSDSFATTIGNRIMALTSAMERETS